MLFQVIHTQAGEDCPGRLPEQMKPLTAWWLALKKTSGVKVLWGTLSPSDSTFYITVQADDYPTLERALGSMVSMGTGRVIPVLTLDQSFPVAESGALAASR